MIQIKTTQNEINDIIQWSSSRYNRYKKKDVVNRIIFLMEKGEDVYERYQVGSYTSHGSLNGWDYEFEIKNGSGTLIEHHEGKTVFSLEKPKRKRFYTGAKRVKLLDSKYEWHQPLINETFSVEKEDVDTYLVANDNGKEMGKVDKEITEIVE